MQLRRDPLWSGGGVRRLCRRRRSDAHGLRAHHRRRALCGVAHERPCSSHGGPLMDEKARKVEDLLQERLRTRTNGHSREETNAEAAAATAESATTPETQSKIEELTNDYKRLAADFSNFRKRNESERADFTKFAKADLIARLLDVLDGYDRALATIPDELKD